MRYRVIKDHKPEAVEPLVFRKGERLAYERRPTGWQGWVWCVSPQGRSGWAPESWLSLEKETCVALRDYDSTELSVEVGDEVVSDLTESGWAWAQNARAQRGWIPLSCLVSV
jgi:hypothetical protein